MTEWSEKFAVEEGWSVFDDSGVCAIQRVDDWLDGEPRFADDEEAQQFVRALAFAGSVYHKQALLLHGTRVPDNNIFLNAKTLSNALFRDREETVRQIMERIVDDNLEDGRGSLVGCLTCWAMTGIDLGNDRTLLGLAESQLEEQQ